MTAKTSRRSDASEEPEETGAEVEATEEPEVAASAPAAKPGTRKKVRRVRVIEVIDDDDDGDLDDVLQALDEAEDEEPPVAQKTAPAAKKATPAKKKPAASTAKIVRTEDESEAETESEFGDDAGDDDEAVAEEAGEKPAKARPKRTTTAASPAWAASLRESGRLVPALVVVLIAALATVAIWQWREASGLSAKEQARRDVIAVVTRYGNVVGRYDANDIQGSVNATQAFLTGDALTNFRSNLNVNELQQNLTKSGLSVTSKTRAVYAGDVNGKFATAVLVFDMTFKSSTGSQDLTKNYLSLGLVKQDGTWKVSSQKPAGREDESAGSTAPGVGGASPTPTATNTPSPKPSN